MENEENLDKVVREHILKVWNAHFRNIAKASRALGIGRTTLYRKLIQYGIRTGGSMR
jgi:transcriptional regulator of acetoin/glycerol metabolism